MSLVSDAEKRVHAMRDELQRLSDRVRLKLHLGEMELKTRYEKLEPSLRDFEGRADSLSKMGGEVGHELKEAWSHLRKALETIEDELPKRGEAEK